MDEEVRTFETWQAERAEANVWVQRVAEAMPEYRRERPREPFEAQLLRERGNPERLIGPSRL